MRRLTLASCAVLLFLTPALALAQSRTPPAGSTSAGTAAPRGGESTSSSSGSSGTASERGGSSTNSGGSSSGSSSSASPVNMSSGRYDGPRSGEASSVARPRNAGASVGQPVPASERPRGDRPTYGQAVPRGSVQPPQNNGVGYPYFDYPYFGNYGYGYYDNYGYGNYGNYGYSGFYDPNMWWTSVGPLYGWGMYALPMSRYSNMWYDYYAAESPSYVQSINGSIKLKVKPKDAEVYVDGTYYGRVDHYDGAFQHLDLRAGTHRVEIRANGYQPIEFQVRVLPGRSTTYNGEMKPVVVK